MPGLVVRGPPLLLVVERLLALRRRAGRGRRPVEVHLLDLVPPGARRQQRGLVAQVLQVGPAHADHVAGDPLQVDVVGQRLVAGVDLEDLEPALPGRPVDGDVPVEAARPQQGRVEHVGPVGGGHDDDRLVRLEAVHLAEDLVERLLAFVASRRRSPRRASGPTASISSMNRMHGAFSLAVLNMSRTRLAPTPTNIWMNSQPLMEKNGTPASPATARASSVLPVPGGPISSTPLGTRAPEPRELLRLLEELDDLLQLALGVLHAGHVLERDAALAASRTRLAGLRV